MQSVEGAEPGARQAVHVQDELPVGAARRGTPTAPSQLGPAGRLPEQQALDPGLIPKKFELAEAPTRTLGVQEGTRGVGLLAALHMFDVGARSFAPYLLSRALRLWGPAAHFESSGPALASYSAGQSKHYTTRAKCRQRSSQPQLPLPRSMVSRETGRTEGHDSHAQRSYLGARPLGIHDATAASSVYGSPEALQPS